MKKRVLIGILIVSLIIVAGFIYFQDEEVDLSTEKEIAEEWIMEDSPTYLERNGSDLRFVDHEIISDEVVELRYEFETEYEGYGDMDRELEEAFPSIEREIVITLEEKEVTSAVTDGQYDELAEQFVEELDEEDEEETDKRVVELYYPKEDEEGVHSVSRTIQVEENLKEKVLEELLKGPTEEESEEGFFDLFDENVELYSANAKEIRGDQVVISNFSAELDPYVKIRNQIEETILQFEDIENVDILIELEDVDWERREERRGEFEEVDLYFVREGGVEEVSREVELINGLPESALRALLDGPTSQEEMLEFETAIPEGVYYHDYKIENEVMTINFSSEFDFTPPFEGSQVKSQIENTLIQFEEISNVEFLVEREDVN